MSAAPVVAVTATTELFRGTPRVRLNAAYVDALRAAGLVPLVVPPLPADLAGRILDAVQGLVLTGGEDVAPRLFGAAPHPTVDAVHDERDASELALVREARRRRMPTLAICRGVQLVNVAFGGTLIQDIPSQCSGASAHDASADRRSRVHDVMVDDGSRLAAAIGAREIATNSMHHQALDRIADAVRVTARATDGIVESVESADPSWWMLGAQWHPEELVDTTEEWDRRLFAAFAAAAAAAAAGNLAPEPYGSTPRASSAPRQTLDASAAPACGRWGTASSR